MNINWLKIGKIAAGVLPVVAGAIGTVVSSKEAKKTTVETTEKLFREYIEQNK